MKTTTTRLCALICAMGLLPLLSACKGKTAEENAQTSPPPTTTAAPANDSARVTQVDVGRSIGADKHINAATDEFGRKDTIYASVATDGNANGAPLTARWTFQDGQVVNESSQNIASSGPAITEFHISKPDGWPVGKYKVEIKLNGQTVQTKDFQVK